MALMKECVRLREHTLGSDHPFHVVSRKVLIRWERGNQELESSGVLGFVE
jgi:hypothetical protein